jgi:hypothetical protein
MGQGIGSYLQVELYPIHKLLGTMIFGAGNKLTVEVVADPNLDFCPVPSVK